MSKTVRSKDVKDVAAREYIEEHHQGQLIYVPTKRARRTKKTAYEVLSKAGYNDEEVARVLGIYMSALEKIKMGV